MKLITYHDEDPALKRTNSHGRVTYRKRNARKVGMFPVFLIVSLVAMPLTAQAGIFTSLMEFLRGPKEQTISMHTELNSQNAPILVASINHDPTAARGGGDITIVGDSALLPDAGPSGTLADVEGAFGSDQISVYVVREGDSLSQIAEMFNVSVNTIIWSNDIKRGSLITPGQTLAILPVTGVRHTVKSGDTIASIVKKYKGHMEEVLQYNDLTEGQTLAVGDVVVVPDGEIEMPKYTNTTTVVRGSGGPSYSGYYMRPVAGVRSQGLHGYNAVDLAAPQGTPIVASAAGNAIIAKNSGWNGGYGKYVVVKHGNGTQTLYAHASSVIIGTGAYVQKGQVIGYVGSTGKSTGPHLHFEVRGAKNPF